MLGIEESWQGNRGSNEIESFSSQKAECNEGKQNGEYHHCALSGHQSCQAVPQTQDQYRPSMPVQNGSKNVILSCLFTG